jgi:hypothetical protein
LADSFPASDPVSCSNPTTGTRQVPVTALPAAQRPAKPRTTRGPGDVSMLAAFIIGFLLSKRL